MPSQLKTSEKLASRLFAVQTPRVLYLSIPKCGCTFVKNVLWFLENGSFHPTPKRVHDDDRSFKRASDLYAKFESIHLEPMAFTVVRNPIDRFMSLYFDKIIGPGQKNYVPLASLLAERRGLCLTPMTAKDHQYNFNVLIEWIQENLETAVNLPREAHWTPQMYRRNVMAAFNLKMLTVEKLSLTGRFLKPMLALTAT